MSEPSHIFWTLPMADPTAPAWTPPAGFVMPDGMTMAHAQASWNPATAPVRVAPNTAAQNQQAAEAARVAALQNTASTTAQQAATDAAAKVASMQQAALDAMTKANKSQADWQAAMRAWHLNPSSKDALTAAQAAQTQLAADQVAVATTTQAAQVTTTTETQIKTGFGAPMSITTVRRPCTL